MQTDNSLSRKISETAGATIRLHDYFRSSAAYRVRIALNLKGLDYQQLPVHLARGEQHSQAYRALNPQGVVPTLEIADLTLHQSLAIIEYLEEVQPQPPLLPSEPSERARVRAIAQAIACDIHPLNNLRVLKYLQNELGQDSDSRLRWYLHWLNAGFQALETLLTADRQTGACCHGDHPGLADLCLVPQLYNARRFDCDLAPYPTLTRIDAYCRDLPAFASAEPGKQMDAE